MKTIPFIPSKLIIPAVVFIGVLAGAPAWVFAHAFPTRETPGAGAVLNAPPTNVTIEFDAPIEKLFSKIRVDNGKSGDLTQGPPTLSASNRRLSVALKPLPPGQYTVHWEVVATDGHRTHGSYVFNLAKSNKWAKR